MKTVFITGTSRGLGYGHVLHCLQLGFQVIAATRDVEGSKAFTRLKQAHGKRFIPVRLDVASEESTAALGESIADHTLDMVINNAGISHEEDFGSWTAPNFVEHFRVNAIGPALVAQALVPFMAENSKLINVSSGLGSLQLNVNPVHGLDAYAMSKAALNMLTRRLAEKLRPKQVTVVSINPGWVRTAMGGEDAWSTVDDAVANMHETINSLTLEQSGAFLSETGEEVPW